MQPCGDQGNGVVKVSLQSNRLKYHDENITVFLEHCEKKHSVLTDDINNIFYYEG